MNADDDLTTIDERGRQAARDLRARAAARPVPGFDTGRLDASMPPAGRSSLGGPRRVLAVAATLLLVVGAAAWWSQRRDDGPTDPSSVVSTQPRPFVLGDVPEGFSLAGAGEVTAAQAGNPGSLAGGPVTMYGPEADDPQLGVARFASFDEDTADEAGWTDLEVDGHRVYQLDGQGLGRHAVVVATGANGRDAVIALSPTLTRAQLVQVLRSAELDEDRRVTVGGDGLPDGWDEAGELPDLLALVSPVSAQAAAPGRYVLYQRGGTGTVSSSDSGSDQAGGDGTSAPETTTTTAPSDPTEGLGLVYLSTTNGDETALRALQLIYDQLDDTEVRGHPAVLATGTVGASSVVTPSLTLGWMERPGELIVLNSVGLTEDELRRTAEGVTALSETEWQDLVERSQLGEFDPANRDDAGTLLADGRFADGTRWRLRFTEEGSGPDASVSLDLAVSDQGDGDSNGSSYAADPGSDQEAPLVALEILQVGSRTYAAAMVGSAVASVELQAADGPVVEEPSIVSGAGRRAVVVEVPGSDPAVAHDLVLFDADGTELRRVDLTANGPGEPTSESQTPTTVGDPGD